MIRSWKDRQEIAELYKKFPKSSRLRMLSPDQLQLLKRLAIDKSLQLEVELNDLMLRTPILAPLVLDSEEEYDIAVRYFNHVLLYELAKYAINQKRSKEAAIEVIGTAERKVSDVLKERRLSRLRKQGLHL